MASAISSTAKLAVVICDVFNLVSDLNKRTNPQDPDLLEASIIVRSANLGLNALEVGALLYGSQPQTLEFIKKLEMIPRILNVPLQLIIETEKSDGSLAARVRILENGLVAPLAEFVRTAAEANYYSEKHYSEMDPATGTRPIYEADEDGHSYIVGYRPVDIDEARRNMTSCEDSANAALVVQLATTAGVATAVTREVATFAQSIYPRLAPYFRQVPNRVRAPAQAQPPAQEGHAVLDAQDRIDLLALRRIPAPLAGDACLSRYICPISQEPIRFVVADPTTQPHTLYEKTSILVWLARHQTSPTSRQPLYPYQLLEKPAVQALIDSRLAMHSDGLNAYLSAQAERPVDGPLLAAAEAELRV